MQQRKINVLCLYDEDFQRAYGSARNTIGKTMNFVMAKLSKGFAFEIKIKKFDSSSMKETWKQGFALIEKNNEDVIIAFINKGFFKIRKSVPAVAVTGENMIIISTLLPFNCKRLNRFFLKRVLLHEFGHIFKLIDSLWSKISIMDYGSLLLFSRFTKKQTAQIETYLRGNKKIGAYFHDHPFEIFGIKFKI